LEWEGGKREFGVSGRWGGEEMAGTRDKAKSIPEQCNGVPIFTKTNRDYRRLIGDSPVGLVPTQKKA
jgi:hypothetical protein